MSAGYLYRMKKGSKTRAANMKFAYPKTKSRDHVSEQLAFGKMTKFAQKMYCM